MGKRGPKPRPASEKALLGFPGKRKGERLSDALAAQESNLRIMPPAWLEEISGAANIWHEIVPSIPFKLLPHQVPLFSDFCICLARLRSEEKSIQKEGRMKAGERSRGERVRNPRMMTASKYREAVIKWSDRFYLTPGASASIRQQKDEPIRAGILNGQFPAS